jgi:RecA-family ATPase
MTQLWASADLAAHTFPTPAYLVDPVIPQGGIAILHGKPGAGKTQFVITLAQAINSGTPFLNRWSTRQGSVVVIQADMTGQIQQDRISHAINDVNLSRTYWTAEPDGSTPTINIQTLSLTDPDLVARIREIDPVLVVWDTLRKVHRLGENASETPVIVFEAARSICPTATHLFLHHDKKASRDPDAVDTDDEDFMGTQQWKGSADATFSLKEISTSPKRLVLTFHKARTAKDTERTPMLLELDIETILLLPA